jgi:hypothetical protein
MATKTLAQLRKFNLCVCVGGVLSAERVIADDGTRSIKVLTCDQHKSGFADKTLATLAETGLALSVEQGKAREPVEE